MRPVNYEIKISNLNSIYSYDYEEKTVYIMDEDTFNYAKDKIQKVNDTLRRIEDR